MLSDEELYLQNYWKPKVGHQLLYDGNIVTITSIDKDYPEQVKVAEIDDILYLQDHFWYPTLKDLKQVLLDLGCTLYPNFIRVGKRVLKELPTEIKSYANLIKEVRMVFRSELGKDPLTTYFG